MSITPETTTDQEVTQADVAGKYYSAFERKQDNLNNRLAIAKERLARERQRLPGRLATFKERYPERDPPVDILRSGVSRGERAVARLENILAFLRPTSDADIDYRGRVMDQLGPAIRTAIPEGLPLRFHGAPIYTARDILKSGHISSSVDRLGYETSYDAAGQISATTAGTLETTLGSYTGLNEEDYCVPPGCIFVLLPATEEEASAGDSLLMNNVDFRQQPERLFAVLAAPEILGDVRQWAAHEGVDPGKVEEFFSFSENLAAIKTNVEAGVVVVQDYVPYPIPRPSNLD